MAYIPKPAQYSETRCDSRQPQQRNTRQAVGTCGAFILASLIAGCAGHTSPPVVDAPVIDPDQQQRIAAMRSYRECATEVVETDRQARMAKSAALYLVSARVAQRCEIDVAPYAPEPVAEERMKTYALGTVNAVKGGDATRAMSMLESFKTTFEGKDLRFADGTSFIDTMDVLLAGTQRPHLNRFSSQNVSPTLKHELRRVDNWSMR